jgi:hypothetical protein
MSGPRRGNLNSHTIKNKTLISITFSLIVLVSMCTLLPFPRAFAATIVSDDFNDNSIDTAKWDPNTLFTSLTDTNMSIAETSQRLEIGPLLQNVNGPIQFLLEMKSIVGPYERDFVAATVRLMKYAS